MFDEEKGWYLVEILEQTGRLEWYLSQLLPAFRNLRNENDQDQRNDILGCLMRKGYAQARQTLNDLWREDVKKNKIYSASAFLRYGTTDDYRTVLQHLEEAWQNKRKPHEEGWRIHSYAQDGIGEKQAAKVRKPFLERNPKFARIADFPESNEHNPRPDRDEFETVEEYIYAAQRVPRSLLDDAGIAIVVKLLQTELKEDQLKAALRVFFRFPFPADVNILLNLLDHESERIQYAVLNVTADVKHPLIREAILHRSFPPQIRCNSITALEANFEPGDEKWIGEQIASLKGPWHLHVARICLRAVIEKHPKGNWTQLLTEAYEFSACQICRLACAELLHKRRVLPHSELEALQYDAYDHARKWATKQLRKIKRKDAKTKH